MKTITTRAQLIELAQSLGVRDSWHEPDEQGVTARVEGESFDNAGFWPTGQVFNGAIFSNNVPRTMRSVEMHVVLYAVPDNLKEVWEPADGEGDPIAAINLATLFAWACGYTDE